VARLRIIVGGYLGLLRAGGVAWDYVQYPAGLLELGHDVYYVEDTRLWPQYSDDAADGAAIARHLAGVAADFGLAGRWAYRDEASDRCFGLSDAALADLCRSADVFVNVSCSTLLREEYRRIPVRILIDTDPMFTQVQHETQAGFTPGGNGMREIVAGHTHHFTFGERVGRPGCRMPDCGVRWRPTRQPVLLDRWQAGEPPAGAPFTTLMNWSAGRRLEFSGETWGQKDVEFAKVLDLPSRVRPARLAAVVNQTGGGRVPATELRQLGWDVLNPREHAGDWRAYQTFIAGSAGEFSVAKETYVKAQTGWFSCRSACYLAAGRPVVAQDTGWSDHYPTGEGLFAFDDVATAADAIHRLVADPVRHRRAARRIAEEFFDARPVLTRLLGEAGCV
jgi:hypothetical protein